MARYGCGGDRCTCKVIAGENVTVDGDGATTSPYVISAEGTGPLVVGPGLLGDGTAGSPLVPSVSDWPYPCDLDGDGGLVFVDSAGRLRSEPRGQAVYTGSFGNETYPDVTVPAAARTVILSESLTITNPSACRPAIALVNGDMDVSFDLPAGSGAGSAMGTDAMTHTWNRGTGMAENAHVQTAKTWRINLAAGATVVEPYEVSVGNGSGGARYNRAQWSVRAFVFAL